MLLGTETPAGWSFYSTAMTCETAWALRYIDGLTLREEPEYFAVGSAYHALLKGDSLAKVSKAYPKAVEEAKALFEKRTSKLAPPLPKAVAKEKLLVLSAGILAGKFTSRPDRVEETAVRDFKSLRTIGENTEAAYQVDGEIIGEMLTAGKNKAVVDIISKNTLDIRQVEVELTAKKELAFTRYIDEAIATVRDILRKRSHSLPTNQNLKACAPGSKCAYYEHCWGTAREQQLLYKKVDRSDWKEFVLHN